MQRTSEHDMQANVSESEKAKKKSQSVGLRWLSAAVAMPIALALVWFGGWAAFAGTAVIVLIGTVELHQMLLHAGYHPLIWISSGLSILFLVAAMFPAQRLLILEVSLSLALLISFPWLFFRAKLDGAMLDWALTLAISLYLGWPMSFFLLLRGYQPATLGGANGVWLFLPTGVWWLLVVLFGAWSFDIAAFFTGRYFGRHKLAPHISPGKTWEGVAGGFIFSIIVTLLLAVRPLGIPWYLAILLGVLIGAAAVFGDLAESLIKRQTHVKDSGQIMPGHGGILDRVDSALFVVTVVYLFTLVIGK